MNKTFVISMFRHSGYRDVDLEMKAMILIHTA